MNVATINDYLQSLFEPVTIRDDEYGLTQYGSGNINRIGYATNLTPEVVTKAIEEQADLVITHHDSWDFIYGMKEECHKMLSKHGISHIYAHLPLDSADFGTGGALVEKLGAAVCDKIAPYEGYLCGRTGELPVALSLDSLVDRMQKLCGEKVRCWSNSSKDIKKIGVVPGAGMSNSYIKECVDKGCDAFITGESILYTIQYAQFAGIHMIVGSHTYTELFGVEKLAEMLSTKFSDLTAVQLHEEHVEAQF